MDTDQNDIRIAVSFLEKGEAVVFPTDTVYGLGISIRHALSPHILYDLKGRENNKPIAWLVRGCDDLMQYGVDVSKAVVELAEAFWPGPLTLVVKAGKDVPVAFQGPGGTIALRMPDSGVAQKLIAALDSPVATTSANMSGQRSPMTLEDVDKELIDQVAYVLDDSETQSGRSSTVVDCTTVPARILRQGDISHSDIERFLAVE